MNEPEFYPKDSKDTESQVSWKDKRESLLRGGSDSRKDRRKRDRQLKKEQRKAA